MAYKRYIKIGGKLYGPYEYHSYRDKDGSVKSHYLKKVEHENVTLKKKIKFLEAAISGLMIVLLILVILYVSKPQITGRLSLNLDKEIFNLNEFVSGDIEVDFAEGEFYPADSIIKINFNGQVRELSLEKFMFLTNSSLEKQEQDFYVVRSPQVKGRGNGYGFIGYKEYPVDVFFQLEIAPLINIVENVTEENATNVTNVTNITGENVTNITEGNVTEKPEENVTEEIPLEIPSEVPPEAQPEQPIAEQPPEIPTEVPPEVSAEAEVTAPACKISEAVLTGAAIGTSRIVDGNCSATRAFIYTLKNETAQLVCGSVRTENKNLSDSDVNVYVDQDKVKVTTDYKERVEGFGSKFLTGKEHSIKLDLSAFNFTEDREGTYVLSLEIIYNNVTIMQTAKQIIFMNLSNATNVTNVSHAPILVRDIPDLRILKNNNATLNLSKYFEDPDNDPLSFSSSHIDNISIFFDNGIATIAPEQDFVGSRYVKFYASDGENETESNFVAINVVELMNYTIRVIDKRSNIMDELSINESKIKLKLNKFEKAGKENIDLIAEYIREVETGDENIENESNETKVNSEYNETENINMTITGLAISKNREEVYTVTINFASLANTTIIQIDKPTQEQQAFGIVTEIFAIEPSKDIEIESATITLEKTTTQLITAILQCDEWDIDEFRCKSEWKDSGLEFFDNGTHVSFNTTHFTAYAGFTIYKGLVGNWKLDEGSGTIAVDSVNKNNGTLYNSPQWTTGKNNSGVSFDGEDDYILIEGDDNLNNRDGVSVSLWVYPRSFKTYWPYISGLAVRKWVHGDQWDLRLGDAYLEANKVQFFVYTVGSGVVKLDGNTELNANQWYHIVATWSTKDNTLRIYIDGVQESNTQVAYGQLYDLEDGFIEIGRDAQSNARILDGIIDEVKVYNRALSQSEVTDLYNEFVGNLSNRSTLAIWDLTDVEGGSQTIYINNNNTFYADYTKALTGESIYGKSVSCMFMENSSGDWSEAVEMDFNETIKLYEISRNITNSGIFWFNVSCSNDMGLENLSAIDDFKISAACVGENYSFICGDDVNESCVLNGNLVTEGSTCLNVVVDDIEIDCQGNSIIGTGNWDENGISASDINNLTIKNCEMINLYYGVYFYTVTNSIIKDSVFNSNYYGVYARYSENNTLNNISGNNNIYNGIGIYSSGSNSITNSNLSYNDRGIELYSSSENNITNTTLNNNYYGISMSYSSYNLIHDNEAYNNDCGICLYSYSDYNNITNNSANNNNQYGIYIEYSSENKVTNNNASNNYNGINIANSNYHIVYNNGVNENTYGIRVTSGGPWSLNNISFNNISGGDYGISLENEDRNTIEGNNIDNTGYGINIYIFSGNTGGGNEFLNNKVTNSSTYDFYTFYSGDLIYGYDSVTNLNTDDVVSSFNAWNIALKSASLPEEPPAGYDDIGKFLNITNTSEIYTSPSCIGNALECWQFWEAEQCNSQIGCQWRVWWWWQWCEGYHEPCNSYNESVCETQLNCEWGLPESPWISLKVHYNDSELGTLNESSLRLWKYNDSWNQLESNVNTTGNYVHASIASFSTFAPLGQLLPTGCVSEHYVFRCGDVVNESCTMNANLNTSGTCFTIGANNVVIDCAGYTINYSASVAGYGINNFDGYDNITIKNCTIIQENQSIQGFNIFLNNSDNSKVEYNNLTRGKAGLLVMNSFNLTARHNHGSYFEYGEAFEWNVCEPFNTTEPWKYFESAIWLVDSDNATIWNNTIQGNMSEAGIMNHNGTESAITLCRSNYSNISSNTIRATDTYGIHIYDSTQAIVTYNFINGSNATGATNTNDGIILASGSNHNVSFNEFYYCDEWGLFLSDSNNNTIYNNTANYNGVGIRIVGNYNGVINNSITSLDAVALQGSYNVLDNNWMTTFESYGEGLWLFLAHNNTIINNIITTFDTDSKGITIDHSSNNTFVNNNIKTNENRSYGLFFWHSDGNNFYDSIVNATSAYDIFVYGGGINNLTNITFNKDDVNFWGETSGTIYVKWYLDALVEWSNGSAVQNANVLGWDKYGTLVFNETSGKGGTISGLVGWWEMEEGSGTSAKDSSGYGNNGTLINMEEGDWVNGKIGKALEFDGVNEYVNVPAAPSLKPSNITIEAWVKPIKSTDWENWFGFLQGAYGDGYANGWRFLDINNMLLIQMNFGDGSPAGVMGGALTPGTWTHVVATYDHQYLRLYQDGVEIGTPVAETRDINWESGNRAMQIGLSQFYFNGSIDEVRIYNRALNSSEIQNNYNNGRILRQNITEYYQNSTDKFFFTNYSIKAVKNPQSATQQVNLTTNTQVNLTLDSSAPLIYFVSPTPANNTRNKSTENSAYINVSVDETNEHGAYIDWNRSLVAYWKFNEDSGTIAEDNSTWDNDCNLNDDAAFTVFAKRGNAITLDGDGDYVSCPGITNINSTFRNHSFSIETWVYFNDDSYDDKAICEKAGFDVDEWLHILRRNRVPMFGFYADDLSGITELTSGKWWHLVFTWDSSSRERKIYVNGVLDASDISSGYLNVPALTDFIIGSYGSGAYLNGYIDEFKIWNRVLSEQEIKASYDNKLYRLERNFTNLVGGTYNYYACAEDEAGNSNCTETRLLKINRLPTAPTLLLPENATHTTNRTPSFEWIASTDPDGDSIQYVWILHCDISGVQESCSPTDERTVENLTETNYTPTSNLKNFWDTQEYYLWKVKAWDGLEYGPESSSWELYIVSLVALSTINSTAAFGEMAPGTVDDTIDNVPWPISLQNDGNCYINVSIFATQLWNATPDTNERYQYKFDYLEQNSFNWSSSIVNWANAPIALTIYDVLRQFNYTDTNDSAELDIKLAPISYEPRGIKSSNITLTGTFTDVTE